MRNKPGRWRKAVLYGYWFILFAATTIPPSWMGKLPAPPSSDKTAHFIGYAMLAWLFLWAGERTIDWRVLCRAFGVLTLYGAFDEIHQPLTGRATEFADFVADVVGIVAGIGIWLTTNALFGGSRQPGAGSDAGLH